MAGAGCRYACSGGGQGRQQGLEKLAVHLTLSGKRISFELGRSFLMLNDADLGERIEQEKKKAVFCSCVINLWFCVPFCCLNSSSGF